MVRRTGYRILIAALALPFWFEPLSAAPWRRELPDNRAGRTALEEDRLSEALRHFDAVLEESKGGRFKGETNSQASYNRGAALGRQQRWDEALSAWSEALASEDRELRSNARFNRGLVFEQQQKTTQAMEEYRRALLENSDNERARNNLERLLRMPPPPPNPQPQSESNDGQGGREEQDDSQQEADDQSSGEPGERERENHADGENEEKQRGKIPDEHGEDQADSQGSQSASTGKRLTEEEADRLLRSLETESNRPPLLNGGEPPGEYDPTRDW